ncbi:sensory box histidine kinase [Acidisarcina polymorpha]|uniref:histidine kinase n=1 Tax=Acidisarcina polymorpha TaxID=2211140 RepID=A0A2Z5FZB1_9BACT|nr:ATP-binding protein [Acidisarcina polymorpha]AXC11837.1 sensory box histidine kinase [Acidisarcina polymorpha]
MNIELSVDDVKASDCPERAAIGPPEKPTPIGEIMAALRTIPELEGLSDKEFHWIASHGSERVGPDGSVVFTENEPSHHLTFILGGEVYVRRRNMGPTSLFFGRTGRMTGKLPYSRMKTWGGDGTAAGSFWGLDIHEDCFPAMLQAIPALNQRVVSTLLDRVREFTRADEQTVKLNALGKLAANLAHELNNPASAARRAAETLSSNLRETDAAKCRLGYLCTSDEELNAYCNWMKEARNWVAGATTDSSHSTGVDEEKILNWLEARHIPDAWKIAPPLADARLPVKMLEDLAAAVNSAVLPLAISTFAEAISSERAAETIVGSTSRIFDIITAIKDYSYMDQEPLQEINLVQALESTLAMFRSRLSLVEIRRQYDPMVPALRGFGGELNDVWTALIENALDAMEGHGTLRLSTSLKGRIVFVEVGDSGQGIDPGLKSRIFEPFFTTKPIGKGLGLGLDLVQRVVNKHFGSISVESSPAGTCFQVRLPLDRSRVY